MWYGNLFVITKRIIDTTYNNINKTINCYNLTDNNKDEYIYTRRHGANCKVVTLLYTSSNTTLFTSKTALFSIL